MKKYSIYLLFIGVIGLFSCEDAIDITQPGRLSSDIAFQTVDDLELGVLSSYAELDATHEITFNATFTDEISIGFDNGGQGLGDGRYGFILNSTSTAPANIWTTNYDAINSATRVIEAARTITPEMGEEDKYNEVLGAALAIRAFAHLTLQTYFSTDYSNDGALGAIAVNFIPSIDQELPRSTNGEVFAAITADLNEAESLVPVANGDPTFISRDVITAMKARLAAYREQYSTALSLAQGLVNSYPLADSTQYMDMYDDLDNTEVIWKLERSVGDLYDTQATGGGGWAGSLFAFVNATLLGSPYFEMSRSLYNQYSASDVRLNRIVDPSSIIDPGYASNPNYQDEDILVIRKYPGSDGQPLMNDLKIFRASEMLLIVAEAHADAGNINGMSNSTAAAIKQLRDARLNMDTPLPNYGSQQEAFADVLKERRLELAFEGHRWVDIKRLGVRAGQSVDRDPLDCAINGACSIAADDYRFTLPIPQVELDGNSVIREQQNPGY